MILSYINSQHKSHKHNTQYDTTVHPTSIGNAPIKLTLLTPI